MDKQWTNSHRKPRLNFVHLELQQKKLHFSPFFFDWLKYMNVHIYHYQSYINGNQRFIMRDCEKHS